MKILSQLFLEFFLLVVFLSRISSLNLLSFNIQNFGVTKYSNQGVIDNLIDIIEEYDLVLVMEYVDVGQTVLPGFFEQLNNHVESKNIQFNYTVSERLGRSNNKEQYIFLYRTDAVELVSTFQYADDDDVFERPPYSVLVRSIKPDTGVIPPFFIIASHTKPSDAVAELNYIDEVFYEASASFSTDLGIIMGDLNADCSYVSNTKHANLDLIVDTNFTWWIDKEADTTTSGSDCAYDRIITQSSVNPFVIENSVEIVRFDILLNLTSEMTIAVSDHYPVKISLQGVAESSVMSSKTVMATFTSIQSNSAVSSSISISTSPTVMDGNSGSSQACTVPVILLASLLITIILYLHLY